MSSLVRGMIRMVNDHAFGFWHAPSFILFSVGKK